MLPTSSQPTEESSAREIVATRVLDAPQEMVWRAWADPAHLARWWGPAGFTNSFHQFELKPGGHWRFTMHGPDGTDYENHSVFVEVVPPERIVFRHLEPVHAFRMTVTLEEESRKTRLTWRMLFDSEAESLRVSRFVIEANEQNFDRLEQELAKMQTQL